MASSNPLSHSVKRKRTDNEGMQSSVPTTSIQVERSKIFWFEDGNIVLQAESMQFRVHRGVICVNSSFFDGMFSLPQPANEPQIDGCPLVYCAHDTKQDWANLLMFIYHPLKVCKLNDTLPIAFLGSMLRLGQKYQFDLIRDNALERLKTHIPTTYNAWVEDMDPLDVDGDEPMAYPWIENHEFDLINIALELGILSILPALYYICAVHVPVKSIFDGILRTDGTVSRLSPESQRVVILGQSEIRKSIPRNTLNWLTGHEIAPLHNECMNPKTCLRNRNKRALRILPHLAHNLRYALNYFGWWCKDSECDGDYEVFCPTCTSHLRQQHNDGRRDFWRSLPLLFGLPEWENLQDFIGAVQV